MLTQKRQDITSIPFDVMQRHIFPFLRLKEVTALYCVSKYFDQEGVYDLLKRECARLSIRIELDDMAADTVYAKILSLSHMEPCVLKSLVRIEGEDAKGERLHTTPFLCVVPMWYMPQMGVL